MTANIASIIDVITAHNSFVISSHARPDGDSVGSQLALAQALRALGKHSRIVNHDAPPSSLASLPDIDSIEVSDTATGCDSNVAFILECNSLQRTEVDGLDRDIIINIDHHAGNEMYGTHNWNDETAAACAEQVYTLIQELGVSISYGIGSALYAGILTDTGSFRHANITERTFKICQKVTAAGVNVAELAADIYNNSSIGKIKLTGTLLENIRFKADNRIAILYLNDELLARTNCPQDDVDGLINIPLTAKAVKAVVMIKPQPALTRVSLRSKATLDVRAIAASFGGGGHRNAAGFSTSIAADDIEKQIVSQLQKALDGTPEKSTV